ncbi:MAG: alpha/beta hydrolase [Tateyamaria sp.]|uniref:alpha/beta fold hydrolase n=1 Tax=Tateyamaria sp. TaxID=1929288 RepID=UPI00327B279E
MLHFKVLGEGRPVVILHGVTLDHRHMVEILEPVFKSLEGWQRIYLDLPGHGKSPPQDTIQSQDGILDAVEEFIADKIGANPFALIGLSRGSYISRGIVHRQSNRVQGAALIVPGGNPGSPNPLPKHEILEPDPTILPELPEDEIWVFENFAVVQSRDIMFKRRQILKPAIQLHDKEQEARVKERFNFSFADEEEDTIFEKPSLLVAGRQDWMSGYLDSVDLMHRYTRATVAVLDAAGHGLAFERPEVFTALIADWLQRVAVGWED